MDKSSQQTMIYGDWMHPQIHIFKKFYHLMYNKKSTAFRDCSGVKGIDDSAMLV